MPKIQPHPLKYSQLIKKLKKFGVTEEPRRAKGSERMLILTGKSNPYKGPQIPVKHHGQGTEISTAVINAVLRRFEIDPKKFWK